jgi:hypothetical protein
MKRSLLAFAALFAFAGSAWAQPGPIDDDPADLHIFSSSSFSQSAGGTDWTTLPVFDGKFSVEDVSNKDVSILPWHLVVAVPNFTGLLGDNITKIGTTSVNIGPGPEVTLLSGSAYSALGISGAPNSVSFNNFVTADAAVGVTATSFGLYDFSVSGAGLALLNKAQTNLTLGGNLPAGTVIFGYGFDADGTQFSTAFTNAGVISTQASVVPEPSSFAIAGLGGLGFLGYAARRYFRGRKSD